MPSVNASGVDWPSESTEMHWPPNSVQGSGEPGVHHFGEVGTARSAQRRKPSFPARKIKGGFTEEDGVWVGPGRMGVEPSPSPFCASWTSESVPGGEEASVQMVPLPGSGHGWEFPALRTLGTLAGE